MKAEVIQMFRDLKADNVIRNVGDIFKASDERISELAAKGFVVPMEEPKSKAKVEGTSESKPKKKAAKKK